MSRHGQPSHDRVAGALLGMACGDALGAGYEFTTPRPDEPIRMKGGGLGDFAVGEWTDDTAMAVCIAEVTATGDIDLRAIGQRFLDWYASGPPDIGNQTRGVLGAVSDPADLPAAARRYYERRPHGAAGNGSLMRTAPVALAHLGDDDAIAQAARDVSGLTHADPLTGEACVLWCIAIDRAVREGRLDGVRDGLRLLAGDRAKFWSAKLDAAETASSSSFTPNGFVVTALQAAYAAIVQTPVPDDVPALHLQHALEAAVRIGNDTDTVAAIAGMVLGARWGASAIPFAWRRVLHGWPGLRARGLVRLAILTAEGGDTGADRWPTRAHEPLQGERPWHAPLHTDGGVVLGNLAALPDAVSQVDAVVSLCRVGTEDLVGDVELHEVWLADRPAEADNPNLDLVLADAADAVATLRAEGKRVFLHCVGGRSRTPTVAALFLHRARNVPIDEALDEVRTVAPYDDHNRAFREALQRLQSSAPRDQTPAPERRR